MRSAVASRGPHSAQLRHCLAPRRGGARCSAAATQLASATDAVDWDNLGFGIENVAPNMFTTTWTAESGWANGGVQPYGPIPMMPSAQVLNYGQSIFEGMKAQRTAEGEIVLFRPQKNAERMRAGAARLSMVAPPEDVFLEGVLQCVRSNAHMVPPHGKGSMYLRPLLLGTQPILGLAPACVFTFLVFGAAVGTYFKGAQLSPIDLLVETHFHRSAPGGMGGTKCAGNYSPVLVTQLAAKEQGYSDVVYLDAKTDTLLEEVSSCNIFTVKGKTIRTPALKGTILPGVTRDAVMQIARDRGYTVEEGDVTVTEACDADEVFTTGTAVVVCAVGSLTYKGTKYQFGTPGEPTPVALEIYKAVTGIQTKQLPDPHGWVYSV